MLTIIAIARRAHTSTERWHTWAKTQRDHAQREILHEMEKPNPSEREIIHIIREILDANVNESLRAQPSAVDRDLLHDEEMHFKYRGKSNDYNRKYQRHRREKIGPQHNSPQHNSPQHNSPIEEEIALRREEQQLAADKRALETGEDLPP